VKNIEQEIQTRVESNAWGLPERPELNEWRASGVSQLPAEYSISIEGHYSARRL
jgi:hypothetical protein